MNLLLIIKKFLIYDALTDAEFNQKLTERDNRQSTVTGIIIFIVELGMIILTLVNPGMYQPELLWIYRVHYISLACFAAASFFVTKYFDTHPIAKQKHLLKQTIIVNFFGIAWGASLTLLDQSNGNQVVVYLTFMLLLTAGNLIHPIYTGSILIIIQVIFITALPHFQPVEDLIAGVQLNTSFFVLFAFLISRQLFIKDYKDYIKDHVIDLQHDELVKRNHQLIMINKIDPMTKLYNRYSLDETLKLEFDIAKTKNQNVGILMIDIDKFKQFNDTYGHINGDKCIIEVGKIILSISETYGGFPFRYGGDEFLYLIRNTDESGLQDIINKINDSIAKIDLHIIEETIPVNLSIGWCIGSTKDFKDAWEMIDQADKDLYRIKLSK